MRNFIKQCICAGLLGAALVTARVKEPVSNPTVTIADGVIIGTATGVLNQPEQTNLVNAYLGIPFAQSPPIRFAPPEAPGKWTRPLEAQQLPPACLQIFGPGLPGILSREFFDNPGLPLPVDSEDCLYLNVFAPQDASPEKLKPVMFWVFGGNLMFGTASLAHYNGSSLAVNHGVVVVTANYRTNMFGFSNSPDIASGLKNSGYLDQRRALQWVQNNIRQFGGDPDQVTIFGESAGGYSVRDLLANPPSPLPYRAAIMESEAVACLKSGPIGYEQVAAHFGCALVRSTLQCLRQIPGNAIQDYLNNNTVSFCPDDDGITHTQNALPNILSGKFANVPILIGTNKDEGRVFTAILGLNTAGDTFNNYLAPIGLKFSPAQQAAVIAQYDSDIAAVPYSLASQIITDAVFTCRTHALSEAIVAGGRQSVWRYRYDAAFPNTSPFPDAGAYHSSEIPEVWGTYPLANSLGKAAVNQIVLSEYMQSVWSNFTKNPSAGAPWPKLSGSGVGDELGILGGQENPTDEKTESLFMADYPCAAYIPVLEAADFAY